MDDQVRSLIIIGSGPAGYAAGVYASRAQLAPLMLAGETAGGQLMFTTEVENYAGFPKGILGPQLMMDMRAQAERFGTEIVDEFVSWVDFSKRPFEVGIGANDDSLGKPKKVYRAKTILLATGATAMMLDIPGEREYLGRGVATCAVCDAAFYRDKRVVVVGGGDAAMEDTLALTKFATHVTVLVRGERLRASKIMQERVVNHEKVTIMYNTKATEVIGDGNKVMRVRVADGESGKELEIDTDGFFLAIGHTPATGFLAGSGVMLEEKGYVLTGLTGGAKLFPGLNQSDLHAVWVEGYPSMTNIEGVFAAGDNVDFRYRQAMTAAGFGTMAALDVEKWLERHP